MRDVSHRVVLSEVPRKLQPYQSPQSPALNHRPLEGRQSSPSFIRPRDDHNAEIVLPSVAPFPRDDHNAEISAPSVAPFKRPDIEPVAPAAGSAGAPHGGGRCHQRFWSIGINGLGGASNRRTTTYEGEDMTPKRILGLAIAASAALASSAALAATTPERVRGTIASATADSVTVDTNAHKPVTVALSGNTSYLKVEKTNLNKVEKGRNVGPAAKDVGDTQVALGVVIFPPPTATCVPPTSLVAVPM